MRSEHGIPVALWDRLVGLRSQVRKLLWIRGLSILVSLLTLGMALALLVDLQWELSSGMRSALLGSLAIAGSIGLARTVWKVRRLQLSDVELAAIVEAAHPELSERLTSTVALNDPDLSEAFKGSSFMRDQLLNQTLAAVDSVPVEQSVTPHRTARAAVIATLLFLLCWVPWGLAPRSYQLLLTRLFDPWGNHASVGRVYFELESGDRVVARGADVHIVAAVHRRVASAELPASVELNWRSTTGMADARAMQYVDDSQAFVTTIPHVFDTFNYYIASDSSRSRSFRIDVVDAPQITRCTLDIDPPAYMGLPAVRNDGGVGRISVYEHSRLTCRLEFNKPVKGVEWIWEATDFRPTSSIDDAHSDIQSATLAQDGKSATLDFEVTRGGPFRWRITDRFGLNNPKEPAREVVLQRDAPPTLQLTGVATAQTIKPSDVFPVHVVATDDVRLGALELHVETDGKQRPPVKVDAQRLGTRQLNHTFQIDLAEMSVPVGAIVVYRVRVADERPEPGPQVVWSNPRSLHVQPDAKPLGTQELADEQDAIRKQLKKIREDLAANRQAVEQVHSQSVSDLGQDLPFEQNTALPPLATKQVAMARDLEGLHAVMAGHVLYAKLMDAARDAARDHLPKSTALVSEAVDSPLEEKADLLAASVEQLRAAERKLGDLDREFESLAELEQDLLELNRLANQAERLAQRTLELQKQRDEMPEDLTPLDQQARLEDADSQQQLLQQQQQQLASRLNDLLERRPELIDAARQHNLDRLAELSKAALDLVEPEDLLAESMQAEASRSSAENAPLINELERLQQDVSGLEQELARHPNGDRVQSVDVDALRKAIEALKAGNVAAAESEIDQGATEIAEVARQIEELRQFGADPQQRLAKLSEKQKALQSRIAETSQNAPETDASADQRQEFSKKLRALASEQVVLQAALAEMRLPRRVESQQRQAVQHAAEAVGSLLNRDEAAATRQAQQTLDDIQQLTQQVGDEPLRRQRAAKELAELRQRQAQLNTQVEQQLQSEQPVTPAERDEWAAAQNALSRQLADLDLPRNARHQGEAVQTSVQAEQDLDRGRLEAATAEQRQAEQHLADLQKSMEEQPTSQDAVGRLRQQQADVATKLAAANTPDERGQLAQDQQQIAQQLKSLDVPAAEPQQAAALDAAGRAARNIDGKSEATAMREAVDRASQRLDDLAEALQASSRQERAARTKQLAQRQQTAAQAAEAREDTAEVPPADRRRQSRNEAEQILQQAQRIPTEDSGRDQKTAAIDALRKTRHVQDQIEKAAQKLESTTEQPEADERMRQLLEQETESQSQAAQALNQLAETPAAQAAVDDDKSRQAFHALQRPTPHAPQQAARDAARLADDLERLRGRTQELAESTNATQRAAEMEDVARQQQALRARADQLSPSQQPLQRAETIQDLNRALDAARAGKPQQAAEAQAAAEQRLRNMAQTAQSVASGRDSAFAAKPLQDPLAQKAAELAQSERQIQNQIRRKTQATSATDATAIDPQPRTPSTTTGDATEVAQQQEQLTREAVELALDAAQQQGADSPAAEQAARFARGSTETARHMRAGQLAQAGRLAERAAQTATQAGQALQQAGPEAAKLAERADTLAAQQRGISQRMEQLSQQPDQRAAAQATGQNQLAQHATQLAQQLAKTARQLQEQPLDLPESGQQARSTQQAVEQAQQAMRQAAGQIAQGNAQHAAQAAQQASQTLRQAAQGAQPQEQAGGESLVPGEFAQMIAEAAQHLKQAGEQLGDPGSDSSPAGEANAGQNGNQTAQQPSRSKSASGQTTTDSAAPGDASGESGQSDSQSPGLTKSAESMRQAAQSLAQAAQQVQPGQSPSRQTAPGKPSQSSDSGQGASGPVDLSTLDSKLQRLTQREWGRLPGSLRTEILQAADRKPNSDYAPLIKFYFQQIARGSPARDD